MPSKTFYANNISETSCSSCRDWSDKANLKKEGGYAQCGSGSKTIAGKSGTHKNPSSLTLTNFKVKIPTGAMITGIKVEYAHQKVAYQGAVPNIPAPAISLVGVSGQSTTGSIPTTSMGAKSVNFSFKPATSNITSSSFGVKINYPANKNGNPGYLRLKYVRVVVTYTEASYSVGVSKVESVDKEVGDSLNLNVSINNKNRVNYNPSVVISLPDGVSFNSKVSGTGSFSKSGNNVLWNPNLSSSKVSSNAVIKVALNKSGSKQITIEETLGNNSASVSFFVSDKKVQLTTVTSDDVIARILEGPVEGELDGNKQPETPPEDPEPEPEEPESSDALSIYELQTADIKIILKDEQLELLRQYRSFSYLFFKVIRNDVDITGKFQVNDTNLNDFKAYYDDLKDNNFVLHLTPQEGSWSKDECKLKAILHIDYTELFGG